MLLICKKRCSDTRNDQMQILGIAGPLRHTAGAVLCLVQGACFCGEPHEQGPRGGGDRIGYLPKMRNCRHLLSATNAQTASTRPYGHAPEREPRTALFKRTEDQHRGHTRKPE